MSTRLPLSLATTWTPGALIRCQDEDEQRQRQNESAVFRSVAWMKPPISGCLEGGSRDPPEARFNGFLPRAADLDRPCQTSSPWSCTRMSPFCSVPNRATSLNLLATAAFSAGDRARRTGPVPFNQCSTVMPLTLTRLRFHSPAGFGSRFEQRAHRTAADDCRLGQPSHPVLVVDHLVINGRWQNHVLQLGNYCSLLPPSAIRHSDELEMIDVSVEMRSRDRACPCIVLCERQHTVITSTAFRRIRLLLAAPAVERLAVEEHLPARQVFCRQTGFRGSDRRCRQRPAFGFEQSEARAAQGGPTRVRKMNVES